MSTTRTLRRYKGWAYDPKLQEFRHLEGRGCWGSVSGLINYTIGLTDNDHAPLMDLKKRPYEPPLTLGVVVSGWYEKTSHHTYITNDDLLKLFSDLRAAFPHIDDAQEDTVYQVLRAAFPHIDTPEDA